MGITLRTSKSGDGSLSLYQAAQHFAGLVKANGLLQAIRTTFSTARQLFFRDSGGLGFRSGQTKDNNDPVLRGVPREWALTVRHLIGVNNYYQKKRFPKSSCFHNLYSIARTDRALGKQA